MNGGGAALGQAFAAMAAAAINTSLLADLNLVLQVCQLTVGQRTALTTGQALGNLDDLKGLSTEDARGLVKNHNESQTSTANGRAAKLGFIQEIWWLHDKDQNQQVPDPNDWTAAKMLLTHRQLEIADQAEKLDDIKVEIPKMGTNEMGIKYYDWDKN